MQVTTDDLFRVIGEKEVELQVMRRRLAEAESVLANTKLAAEAAEAAAADLRRKLVMATPAEVTI